MTRFILSIFSLSILSITAVSGQEDFAQLSTKERINIAENEEKEASSDVAFQTIMQNGHELFKERHYLKAIRSYEQAQERRPYNVYPKVIIADIELSMKDTLETLRAAEKAETRKEQIKKAPEKTIQPEKDTPEPESEKERLEKLEKWENQERERMERERELEKERKESQPAKTQMEGDVAILSTEDFRKELGDRYPNGVTEEVYTEGNKTITKRIIVSDGIGNEYKKVVHGWGGIFYFKNGEAVTERVWTQESEK